MTEDAAAQVDYSKLSRAVLERRLRLAEDTCLMYGWTPAIGPNATDREKAANILWSRWHDAAGRDTDVRRNEHLNDEAVEALARERDENVARSKRRISEAVEAKP